jgi:hypothetical protein
LYIPGARNDAQPTTNVFQSVDLKKETLIGSGVSDAAIDVFTGIFSLAWVPVRLGSAIVVICVAE